VLCVYVGVVGVWVCGYVGLIVLAR